MKVVEAIKQAVDTGNATMAGRCADILRVRCGMTYEQIFTFAREQVPTLTRAKWEGFMYEADTE